MAKVLTDIAVNKLKPSLKRREVPDAGARGLRVIVQPVGREELRLTLPLPWPHDEVDAG